MIKDVGIEPVDHHVIFRSDGTALDASPVHRDIVRYESLSSMCWYSDVLARYGAHFRYLPGESTTEGYYRIDYDNDEEFKRALSDGHSIEVLFCMDSMSDGTTEIKPFSSMHKGGTGILISKENKGRDITFLPNISVDGTSGWVWTQSGIVPDCGRYYHTIGVWIYARRFSKYPREPPYSI